MHIKSDTLYDYLSATDLELGNNMRKAAQNSEVSLFRNYLSKPDNSSLRRAFKILEEGLDSWITNKNSSTDAQYSLAKRKERQKYGLGKSLMAYLKRTRTVVLFTDEFGNKSSTSGGLVNGAWQQGDLTLVGTGKEKYKMRKHNIIWLSSDLKKSPAAIAMLIAHEVGHGIAQEYRDNYPLPYGDKDAVKEALKKPPYTFFPHSEEDDDDQICYPMECLMAEELGFFNVTVETTTSMTPEARRWYIENFGRLTTLAFHDKLRMGTVIARRENYVKHKHVCGMRCKFFKEYGYCSRPVVVRPCYQFAQHLEGWSTPDKDAPGQLPPDFKPLKPGPHLGQ